MNKWINVYFLTCIFLFGVFSVEATAIEVTTAGGNAFEETTGGGNAAEETTAGRNAAGRTAAEKMAAEETIAMDISRDFNRWQQLMDSGSWRAASVEAERIFFHSSDRIVRSQAVLARSWALKSLGDYRGALDNLRRASLRNLPPELQYRIHHERALLNYLDGNPAEAVMEVRRLNHAVSNEDWRLLSGYLEVLALIELGRRDEALMQMESYFRDLEIDPGAFSEGGISADGTENDGQAESGTPGMQYPVPYPDEKNPQTAAWLSTFLPGSGQIYAGRTFEGIGSAGLQLTALGWGVYNVYTGFYLTALFTGGGLFQAFYFGGIDRAERHAHHYNRAEEEAFKHVVIAKFLAIVEPSLKQKRQTLSDSPFLQ